MFENIEKAEIDQEKINMYLGQAYFYRSHAYFWLAENWGDAVIELHSRNTGAKAREPFHKVLDQAIEDAQKAIELLPAFKNLTDENGKPTTKRDIPCKEAGYSLVAYVYAWKASLNNEPNLYKSAIGALDEVLKQTEYYDLAATPEEVCTQLLRGVSHRESIFEVNNGWSDGGMMNHSSPAYYVTQFPVDPTKKEGDIETANSRIFNTTVDRMFPKGDARREAYFYNTDSYRDEASLAITGGNAYPYKYRYPLLTTSGTNIGQMQKLGEARIMFRVADLLLLRAECYARTSNDGAAITDLNRVRTRVNAALYGVNPEPGDLRYTIFKEREKELLWECHRYFDAIRNGYYSEISPAYAKLTETQIQNGAIYIPIDNRAMKENPLMIQNKYWLSRY